MRPCRPSAACVVPSRTSWPPWRRARARSSTSSSRATCPVRSRRSRTRWPRSTSATRSALRVIDRGVGAITETNVDLAAASDAIIIGFNVRPQGKATEMADKEGVEIRYYSVIYQAIEEIEAALKGMLKPEYEESTLGQAEIREIFRSSKIGNIAGCMVTSGVIRRNAKVRLHPRRRGRGRQPRPGLAASARRTTPPRSARASSAVWCCGTSRTSRTAMSSRRSRCARSRAADRRPWPWSVDCTARRSRRRAIATFGRTGRSRRSATRDGGTMSQPTRPQDRRPDPGDRGGDAGAPDQGPAARASSPITDVRVTGDTQQATVFYTVLGEDDGPAPAPPRRSSRPRG